MVRRHLAQQAGAWMEVESIRRLPAALEGSSASPCARSRRGSSGHPRRGTRVHRNSPIPRRIQASIAAWSTPDPATFPPGLSGARGTGGRLLQDFDAHGGARELVPMIVDELPDLIVHLEGAHFGSSPPVAGSRTSTAPALVVNLPPFPGNTWTSSKSFQVRLLHLCTGAAGPVAVVFHNQAFRVRQPAAIRNQTVVEHGRIRTGRHLFGKVNVVRIRA